MGVVWYSLLNNRHQENKRSRYLTTDITIIYLIHHAKNYQHLQHLLLYHTHIKTLLAIQILISCNVSKGSRGTGSNRRLGTSSSMHDISRPSSILSIIHMVMSSNYLDPGLPTNSSLHAPEWSGPVFCILLGVNSGYVQPITGQVAEVTCPAISRSQPELTPSKRHKMGPDVCLSDLQFIP